MDKKKILAFAGSNSIESINKKLVRHASDLLSKTDVTLIDLNDFEMPIYGIDLEKSKGLPPKAIEFKNLISEHDAIIMALAEHNGSYASVFKNIFDWISRAEGKAWDEKPVMILSTSPGKRGGSNVLSAAANRFPYNGALVVNTFSLPSFHANFNFEEGITDKAKARELKEKISALEEILG